MNKRLDKRDLIYAGIGSVCVFVTLFLYMILGGNAVVFSGDQLDGEVIGYILHAKYLFSNTSTYTEVMNGISSDGLFPPAPLCILLYRVLPAFWAFAVNQVVCMLIGFLGMYIFLRLVLDRKVICFLVALLFAYLPVLSVYGLCQIGIPILLVAFYNLYNNRFLIASCVIIAIYAGMSSLVLVGYSVCGFLLIFMIYLFAKKEYVRLRNLGIGFLILLAVYIACDSSLILQIFGIGQQVASHKEDLVRNGQDFIDSFINVFFSGTLHTPSHQQVIVFTSEVTILYTIIFRLKGPKVSLLYVLFAFNLFCALFYAFVQSPLIAQLRNDVGGIIKNFQMDRVYWLTVATWYFILALEIDIMYGEFRRLMADRKRIWGLAVGAVCAISLLGTAAIVFKYSDINKNIRRLVYGEAYDKMTWDDFYAPDVFSRIDEYIGRDKSTYRTLSLGIHPASAIYNGFYTLDAYSNNYDLNYKHEFRKIIAGELAKDSGLETYYDNWGCRCYLLSAELGYDEFIYSKSLGRHVVELDIDTQAASDMGAEYIFSAVVIDNADELGLTLMREEPFSTDTSYVGIYLYRIG